MSTSYYLINKNDSLITLSTSPLIKYLLDTAWYFRSQNQHTKKKTGATEKPCPQFLVGSWVNHWAYDGQELPSVHSHLPEKSTGEQTLQEKNSLAGQPKPHILWGEMNLKSFSFRCSPPGKLFLFISPCLCLLVFEAEF